MDRKPSWYTQEDDNSWSRVKAAFRRDWEQTKNDFGSKTAPDLNQDAGDTVRQATEGVAAASATDRFDEHEPAFRFGNAARRQYGTQHKAWNADLESKLRTDFGNDFDQHRDSIRKAYEYNDRETTVPMVDEQPGKRTV